MTLREEVIEALFHAFGGDIDRVNMPHVANAIIPLVLERAAQVADEAAERMVLFQEFNAAHGALRAATAIRDAIRALAEEGDQ
jgi:hypothetical protein